MSLRIIWLIVVSCASALESLPTFDDILKHFNSQPVPEFLQLNPWTLGLDYGSKPVRFGSLKNLTSGGPWKSELLTNGLRYIGIIQFSKFYLENFQYLNGGVEKSGTLHGKNSSLFVDYEIQLKYENYCELHLNKIVVYFENVYVSVNHEKVEIDNEYKSATLDTVNNYLNSVEFKHYLKRNLNVCLFYDIEDCCKGQGENLNDEFDSIQANKSFVQALGTQIRFHRRKYLSDSEEYILEGMQNLRRLGDIVKINRGEDKPGLVRGFLQATNVSLDRAQYLEHEEGKFKSSILELYFESVYIMTPPECVFILEELYITSIRNSIFIPTGSDDELPADREVDGQLRNALNEYFRSSITISDVCSSVKDYLKLCEPDSLFSPIADNDTSLLYKYQDEHPSFMPC